MAGFEYRGQLNGAENPVTTTVVIGNSKTIKVGDAVLVSSGAQRITNTSPNIFGVVQGIVDANGIDLDNASTSNFDGTWTSSSKTYVSSSNNLTNKKVKVLVIADPQALYYNDSDGNFTDPTDQFLFVKCADHDQIDESETSATVGQFQVWKLDPDGDGDASKCLVRIALPQTMAFEPEA